MSYRTINYLRRELFRSKESTAPILGWKQKPHPLPTRDAKSGLKKGSCEGLRCHLPWPVSLAAPWFLFSSSGVSPGNSFPDWKGTWASADTKPAPALADVKPVKPMRSLKSCPGCSTHPEIGASRGSAWSRHSEQRPAGACAALGSLLGFQGPLHMALSEAMEAELKRHHPSTSLRTSPAPLGI